MHRFTHAARRLITPVLVALTALLALPGLASAEGGSLPVIGLEIKAVDPGSRAVTAVLHCVPPEKAGKTLTLTAGPEVDLTKLQVGQMTGAKISLATTPPTIAELESMPCDAQPGGGQPQPGQPTKPGKPAQGDQPGQGGDDPGSDDPTGDQPSEQSDFKPGFLSRVWKFRAEVDSYEDGELSVTVDKVLNLPKRYRDQDDDLVDQDAVVLVSKARVFQDGERVSRDELDGAANVRIHGKLLPEDKWNEDEDGEPVPTIRAKKVYILD